MSFVRWRSRQLSASIFLLREIAMQPFYDGEYDDNEQKWAIKWKNVLIALRSRQDSASAIRLLLLPHEKQLIYVSVNFMCFHALSFYADRELWSIPASIINSKDFAENAISSLGGEKFEAFATEN